MSIRELIDPYGWAGSCGPVGPRKEDEYLYNSLEK